MMEMQDVKERRPHSLRSVDPAEDALETETDPMVPPDVLSLQSRRRSTPESWLRFVFDRIWAVAFLAAASLGLYEADFFREVLHSPLAVRGFVHLGVLFASLLVLFGGYIEVYRGMVLGEQVSYATARTATHGMLVSMLASGLCLAIGLWPVWHWLTLPYLFMWSWGVVVQLLVIFPPVVQRVLFAGGYLWFMHAYLSMFTVSGQ